MVCPDPLLICPTFHCPRDCLHDQYAFRCDFSDGRCSCPFNVTNTTKSNLTALCGNGTVDSSEHEFLRDYYVTDSSVLQDDEKNILDHAARMFVQMSVGEVISFVACSLLVVVTITILFIYTVKLLRQRTDCLSILPRWFPRSNAWKVDLTQWALPYGQRDSENSDKDKMVASVLHNLRVDNTAMGIDIELHEDFDIFDGEEHEDPNAEITATSLPNNSEVDVTRQERTILRSQLPPLPGIGRVLSIPGFRYVDDSMMISNDDDVLTIVEATAAGSRTSCRSSQLESCSIKSVLDDEEVLESSTIRRRK